LSQTIIDDFYAINASGLNKKQIDELRNDLSTKLQSLNNEIIELEKELTQDDDEKAAPDEVDRSSYEEEMQRLQVVLNGKNNLRFEVSEALKRIDDEGYGVCEETEEPIGFKRLKAQPWTRYSLEAQKEIESRKQHIHRSSANDAYPSYSNESDDSTESDDNDLEE
jgi:DnaK suppressor protein